MTWPKLFRNFDWVLLGVVVAMVTYGIFMIHSASQVLASTGNIFDEPPVRQSIFAVLGFTALGVFALLDYRLYRRIAWFLYGGMIVGLILVLFVGDASYGARRWIEFPFGLQFQPSEFGKVILAITLGRLIAQDQRRIKSLPFLVLTAVVAAVPAGLVFLGPDLGTTSMYFLIWLAVVTVSGARLRHLALLLLPVVVMAFIGFRFELLPAYQVARLQTFLNPAADALGEGYNILQAEIAIGSGGLTGKGYMEGTQSQLHYLRVQRTDFIFSVLGEELGFVGAIGLLSLFLVFTLRGARVATLAPDSFGRILVVGIVTMIVAQMFINIGANVRLLPMTGIPLPFVSMGGTALISKLVAVGLLQSVALRRRKADTPMPVPAREWEPLPIAQRRPIPVVHDWR
jgi:rod shape determining protein RodA